MIKHGYSFVSYVLQHLTGSYTEIPNNLFIMFISGNNYCKFTKLSSVFKPSLTTLLQAQWFPMNE